MEYLIIISIIAWLFILKSKPIPKKGCELHVWDRHDQPDDPNLQYLRCRECGTIPGSDEGAEL